MIKDEFTNIAYMVVDAGVMSIDADYIANHLVKGEFTDKSYTDMARRMGINRCLDKHETPEDKDMLLQDMVEACGLSLRYIRERYGIVPFVATFGYARSCWDWHVLCTAMIKLETMIR
jgi:hypothetical protein